MKIEIKMVSHDVNPEHQKRKCYVGLGVAGIAIGLLFLSFAWDIRRPTIKIDLTQGQEADRVETLLEPDLTIRLFKPTVVCGEEVKCVEIVVPLGTTRIHVTIKLGESVIPVPLPEIDPNTMKLDISVPDEIRDVALVVKGGPGNPLQSQLSIDIDTYISKSLNLEIPTLVSISPFNDANQNVAVLYLRFPPDLKAADGEQVPATKLSTDAGKGVEGFTIKSISAKLLALDNLTVTESTAKVPDNGAGLEETIPELNATPALAAGNSEPATELSQTDSSNDNVEFPEAKEILPNYYYAYYADGDLTALEDAEIIKEEPNLDKSTSTESGINLAPVGVEESTITAGTGTDEISATPEKLV